MELIAVADENWAIGRDDEQLLYIPEDLKRFRALTMGRTVIVGRKTLSTFPGGKPLAGRMNLILSTGDRWDLGGQNARVYGDLPSLLRDAPQDAMVIGGESVYRQLLPLCDRAYITKICAAFPADRFLPNLDRDPQWELRGRSQKMENQGISYYYTEYRRKQPLQNDLSADFNN